MIVLEAYYQLVHEHLQQDMITLGTDRPLFPHPTPSHLTSPLLVMCCLPYITLPIIQLGLPCFHFFCPWFTHTHLTVHPYIYPTTLEGKEQLRTYRKINNIRCLPVPLTHACCSTTYHENTLSIYH